MAEMYLLESKKHGPVGDIVLWWAENSRGYTTNIDKAGRYTKDEAERICAGSNEYSKRPLTLMHKESIVMPLARRCVDCGDLFQAACSEKEVSHG